MKLPVAHPKDERQEVPMLFQVKVRVEVSRMAEFGAKLQAGALDRSAIRGETYCLAEDPAVGYSVWEAPDREAFEARFAAWRPFYAEVEARELITPVESMRLLAPRR
jgi:hypothetical protein